MMISILNTVEYNEYKFGTRDEAVIASLRPFITKLASALTAVLTSATYLLFDVTSYTNQISSLEQQCTQGLITESEKLDLISGVLSSTTSLQSTGLLLCMSLLPCAMMLLSYFLYKKKYILDETEYDRICVELHKAVAFPPCHRRKTVKQNSFQKIQKTVGSRLPKALQNRRSFSFMTIECSQSVHSIVYIFSEFVLLLL